MQLIKVEIGRSSNGTNPANYKMVKTLSTICVMTVQSYSLPEYHIISFGEQYPTFTIHIRTISR